MRKQSVKGRREKVVGGKYKRKHEEIVREETRKESEGRKKRRSEDREK